MNTLLQLLVALTLFSVACATKENFHIDAETLTFRDAHNQTRIWHGTNFVVKATPFYPNVTASTIADLKDIGANVVRLGVMMPGLFPWANGSADEQYLAKVCSPEPIYTIIDSL